MPRVRNYLSRKFPRAFGWLNKEGKKTAGKESSRQIGSIQQFHELQKEFAEAATARGQKQRDDPKIVKLDGRVMRFKAYGSERKHLTVRISRIALEENRCYLDLSILDNLPPIKVMLERKGDFFVSEPFGRSNFGSQLGILSNGVSYFQGHFVLKMSEKGSGRGHELYFIDFSKNIEVLAG